MLNFRVKANHRAMFFRSWASIQVYFDSLDFESHLMSPASVMDSVGKLNKPF